MGPGSGDAGQRIGGYEIEGLLGRGGMGTVYKAHQISLGRRVALKVIRPELRLDDEVVARFRREASAGALTHPNIVSVYDVGEDGDDLYIAMAYLPGGSLADRLQRHGPPATDRVLRIGREIASALSFAHDHGIVHRDVKPSNILFDAADNAVLADFGVAAVKGATALTGTMALVGSPSYMAPELTRGQLATPASDLYALGCTLYETVTGHPPFTGEDALAVLVQHRADQPPELPEDCPSALKASIESLLAKDPDQRSFEALLGPALDLDPTSDPAATIGGQPWAARTSSSTPTPSDQDESSPPTPPPYAVRADEGSGGSGRHRRSRRLIAAGVSVVALVAVGAFLLNRESPSDSPNERASSTRTTTGSTTPVASATSSTTTNVPPTTVPDEMTIQRLIEIPAPDCSFPPGEFGFEGILGPPGTDRLQAVVGDVTGDGLADGAYTFHCSGGGSGVDYRTFVFNSDGNLLAELPVRQDAGQTLSGYRYDLRIRDGLVKLKAHGATDCTACAPRYISYLTYQWNGTAFERLPEIGLSDY